MVGEPFIEPFIEGEDVDAAYEVEYPRLLALRDAPTYQQLIRDALGDPDLEVVPAHLWQADETAGAAIDLIGDADLTANGGTRVVTDVGSGTLDGAMATAIGTANWRVASAAALQLPAGVAFAFVMVVDLPAQAGNTDIIGKAQAVPLRYLHLYINGAGELVMSWDDGVVPAGAVVTVGTILELGRLVVIVGASIVEELAYITSTVAAATGAYDPTTNLNNAGRFSVGALDGVTLGSDQVMTHLAMFTGADAEVVLAHRVALAARLLTL